MHVGVALGAAGQLFPQAPQLIVLVIVSTHMPIPQLLCPAAQPLEHVPALQLGVAPLHSTPQAPQLVEALDEASQPFAAAMSQSR